MVTVTIRDIPDDLYADLKQAAEANHRSIDSEVIVCVERAVRPKRSQLIPSEPVPARPPRMWELADGHIITDEEINEAKRAGRP